jgi:LPXTG-motif cell wall-anchored protein
VPVAVASAATSDAGAKVSFSSSAIDVVDGPRPVECTPSSGSVFERGTTTVVCDATDESANRSAAEFVVTVEGTVLTRQADIGDVSVEIASNLDFAAGQYAVIDPGGPDEEVRYIERLGSLHFAAPLAASHPIDTFVTTVAPPGGDTQAPLIAAVAPLTVVQGTALALEVSCTDAGVGVQECRTGTADTSTLGSASVDVVAWDFNGNATEKTVEYRVILAPTDAGPNPGADPGTNPGADPGSKPRGHPVEGTASVPALPNTGMSESPLMPIALILLLAGVLIVVVRRRGSV